MCQLSEIVEVMVLSIRLLRRETMDFGEFLCIAWFLE